MRIGNRIAALSAAMLAAQPCVAAPLGDGFASGAGRVGAFAGAAFVLPLGGPGRRTPIARLELSSVYAADDGRDPGLARRRAAGIALALGGQGRGGL